MKSPVTRMGAPAGTSTTVQLNPAGQPESLGSTGRNQPGGTFPGPPSAKLSCGGMGSVSAHAAKLHPGLRGKFCLIGELGNQPSVDGLRFGSAAGLLETLAHLK